MVSVTPAQRANVRLAVAMIQGGFVSIAKTNDVAVSS